MNCTGSLQDNKKLHRVIAGKQQNCIGPQQDNKKLHRVTAGQQNCTGSLQDNKNLHRVTAEQHKTAQGHHRTRNYTGSLLDKKLHRVTAGQENAQGYPVLRSDFYGIKKTKQKNSLINEITPHTHTYKIITLIIIISMEGRGWEGLEGRGLVVL